MDLNEFMQRSNEAARRGRRLAREMFGAAVLTLFVAGFFIVAAPNGTQAMYLPRPIEVVVPTIGILGLAIGLLWMVRILRANPEPDSSAWRYRDS